MTSITAKIKEPYADAKHVLVTVFAGPDEEHRASLGTLHATWDEAHEIERRLKDVSPAQTKAEAVEAARVAIVDSCGLRVTEGTARDAIDAYFRAIRHTDPPEGWFHFGTHIWGLPSGIGLKWSDELAEDGLPKFEQLVTITPDPPVEGIDEVAAVRAGLIEMRNEALGPQKFDATAAVLLSHAIAWLSVLDQTVTA